MFSYQGFGRSFSEELEKHAFTRSELNLRFEAQWRSVIGATCVILVLRATLSKLVQ